MKKSLKIIYVMMIFVSLVFLLQNVSFASGESSGEDDKSEGAASSWATTMLTDAEKWAPDGEDEISSTAKTVMGTAINVIRVVGTGIAIIMITYVAIKYMSAAPSEKADFKKSATALVVGAVVLFASTNILNVIADFAVDNIK